MVAIIWNLSFAEVAVILIVSVLIFGKRLPQVAGQALRQMSRLRRHLDTLRRESGIDRELYDVRRTFDDLARDVEVEPRGRKPYPGDPAWRGRREPADGEEPARIGGAEGASGEEGAAGEPRRPATSGAEATEDATEPAEGAPEERDRPADAS